MDEITKKLLIDVIKLLLCVAIGVLIGRERESSGKPAGMRTLSLVCMSSAFAGIIATDYFPSETARIFAGIITGIGFLGAGVIIGHSTNVIGVTTSATVWAVALVGMGIGVGGYLISIIFAFLIFLVLIERRIEVTIAQKKEMKKIKN